MIYMQLEKSSMSDNKDIQYTKFLTETDRIGICKFEPYASFTAMQLCGGDEKFVRKLILLAVVLKKENKVIGRLSGTFAVCI